MALAGVEGGEGAPTGRAGGLTGRAGTGASAGTPNGLTGAAGAAGRVALARGVVALAGASAGTAKGTATTGGFTPVGAGDAEEVELLGNALPSTAAAAIGVAEEGIEELLEELFEGGALEMIDWRATERCSRSD